MTKYKKVTKRLEIKDQVGELDISIIAENGNIGLSIDNSVHLLDPISTNLKLSEVKAFITLLQEAVDFLEPKAMITPRLEDLINNKKPPLLPHPNTPWWEVGPPLLGYMPEIDGPTIDHHQDIPEQPYGHIYGSAAGDLSYLKRNIPRK